MLSEAEGPGFLVKGSFTHETVEGSQTETRRPRHREEKAPRGVPEGGPREHRLWVPWRAPSFLTTF